MLHCPRLVPHHRAAGHGSRHPYRSCTPKTEPRDRIAFPLSFPVKVCPHHHRCQQALRAHCLHVNQVVLHRPDAAMCRVPLEDAGVPHPHRMLKRLPLDFLALDHSMPLFDAMAMSNRLGTHQLISPSVKRKTFNSPVTTFPSHVIEMRSHRVSY